MWKHKLLIAVLIGCAVGCLYGAIAWNGPWLLMSVVSCSYNAYQIYTEMKKEQNMKIVEEFLDEKETTA